MIRIDKSLFDADELAQYEALIAKATVDPEAAEDEMEDEMPPMPKRKKPKWEDEEMDDMDKAKSCKKSDTSPVMAAALDRLEKLEKSIEMKEFAEIAKKYAPLGEKEDELAQTLYDMKKSNESNYNAYIGILDKSLNLVNKSGVFSEIGKSAYTAEGSGAVGKINAYAQEIRKADPTVSQEQAIAKAWEDHPEVALEYENERG